MAPAVDTADVPPDGCVALPDVDMPDKEGQHGFGLGRENRRHRRLSRNAKETVHEGGVGRVGDVTLQRSGVGRVKLVDFMV